MWTAGITPPYRHPVVWCGHEKEQGFSHPKGSLSPVSFPSTFHPAHLHLICMFGSQRPFLSGWPPGGMRSCSWFPGTEVLATLACPGTLREGLRLGCGWEVPAFGGVGGSQKMPQGSGVSS